MMLKLINSIREGKRKIDQNETIVKDILKKITYNVRLKIFLKK